MPSHRPPNVSHWKTDYYYYAIFAVCFLGFQYLEDDVRRSYRGANAAAIYLLGVMPNYLPAIGLACFFYVLLPTFASALPARWTERRHATAILVSQVGLIAWEVQQIFAPYGIFDWHDILWTLLGGATIYLIWWLLPGEPASP